jgi:hypothetical protein
VNVVTRSERPAGLAAAVAATGFAGLAVFQAALAAGAPWGHAAWGGESADLSTAQQSASAVAAVVYVAAALIVLCRAGLIWPRAATQPSSGGEPGSSQPRWRSAPSPTSHRRGSWEHVILGPLALVPAALCVVVARRAGTHQEVGQPHAAAP